MELKKVTNTDSAARKYEQAEVYQASVKDPARGSTAAAVRIEGRPGYYAGAAIPEPIRFTCRRGQAPLGDWSALGLGTYSGAVRYARDVTLSVQAANAKVLLNLSDVAAAAEVWVNGRRVDTLVRRPWKVDISGFVRQGKNRIEVLVANTLANHYSVGMPCGNRYIKPGTVRAGLLGPVRIEIWPSPRARDRRQK
ncbi:MAG: glycosylhydrolase-like jelly roll fold domain-containing protein [Planctomycetota bacterium]